MLPPHYLPSAHRTVPCIEPVCTQLCSRSVQGEASTSRSSAALLMPFGFSMSGLEGMGFRGKHLQSKFMRD